MRKLLLITTALIGLAGSPAQATPLITGITSWLTGTFGATLGGIIGKLGGSLLLSAASRALAGSPRQEQQRSELARPTSLPAYRFVYGQCWAPGTPVGWEVVGDYLYICYLLNSRASSLTSHTVLFDKRAVTVTGDPFDFAGAGASATNDPFDGHVKYWIGRGSQTTVPAQIMSETTTFRAADGWRGRTVLWARLDCGSNDDRSSRWPASPPELNVEGDWSLVYDPRDGLTKFSRNQGLIVLDALRNNPAKPHVDAHIRMDTFEWAADVAAQTVAVKGGGTIPRYRCDGVLVWSAGAELEDQIQPLLDAGASRLTRPGGQVAIIPAIARDPVYMLSDFTDGQPATFEKLQPADGLFTEVEATYTSSARAYESAAAPVHIVPGAQAADGGLPNRLTASLDFVLDHRQAQRVAKIMVMRSRQQRTIACEAFPDALIMVAGSICTVDLPAPLTSWNGTYICEEINPSAGVNDDQSITMRAPLRLREESAAIYAWDAETEEQTVEDATFSGTVARVQPPASVTVVSGSDAAIVSGSTVTARVRVTWPASTSASAQAYRWEWRREGGAWQAGGTVQKTAALVGYISPVIIGDDYEARVRTIGLYGTSSWRASSVVVATGPTVAIEAASIRTATGGAGQVALALDQADDPACTKIEVWRSTTNDVGTASLITTRNAAANVTVNWTNSGLTADTYYFWARAKDGFGNVSAYSAVKSATAT